MENGALVESTIAELGAKLKSGLAHYFRSECAPIKAQALTSENMIQDLNDLVKMNNLQDATVWTEEGNKIGIIGRIRAKLDSGTRVYFLDIRIYVSGGNVFAVWAGAERYPTLGIQMFFKSVNFRGEFIYKQ